MKEKGQFNVRINHKSKIILSIGLLLLIPIIVQVHATINQYAINESPAQEVDTQHIPEALYAVEEAAAKVAARAEGSEYYEPNILLFSFRIMTIIAYTEMFFIGFKKK